MSVSFRSHGKLLLTGEYAVLDGAEALALPTRFGQTLTVEEGDTPGLAWKSLDHEGRVWFEAHFEDSEFDKNSGHPSGKDTRSILLGLLREALRVNPEFRSKISGRRALSRLEFPREWGLGSSSTLISNLAQWAGADPYVLLWNAFGGSGYDIACARADGPLTYRVQNQVPVAEPVLFDPPFKDHLYFVYLNRKQNSREAISAYKKNGAKQEGFLQRVTEITRAVARCSAQDEFNALLKEHESLLAGALQMQPVQEQLFPDFKGVVKSLGAWGGDFVLASGKGDIPAYFRNKGLDTILPYRDMIL
ncbi:Mevalonate kinase [Muriicola jejuensis]|uniref:GHMP kinase n=1 Tax=Muriicola jejuensis TaxID=504488 RepID=A0A6P0UED8_9FLAO|nr:GYDIA family GHMP kinase [Muriicola jejuensis]NER11641.1 GHMP kinase [Muriicola jejuensis]SMP25749.1 Mevalonate kinase [Muriicola jejuensis]